MIINIERIFRPTASYYSEQTALVNVERNRRFSFWQLHLLTNKICNLLMGKFSLTEGDTFAILLENDNMSLLHLWVTKASCSALWLGIRDSAEEHFYQIDYVEPEVIFIESSLLSEYYEPLTQRNIQIICFDEPEFKKDNVHYFWQLLEDCSSKAPGVEYIADDSTKHRCLFRFTGGTTGKGKCAMYSLSNLLSAGCNSSNYSEVLPDDKPKVLVSTPITHAAGAIVLPAFFRGGTIFTLNRADIELICQTTETEQLELIYTVPTVLYRMLDLGLPQKYNLKSLKTIRYGASPISPTKLEQLISEFGLIFVQGYASTESWVPGTILGRNDHDYSTVKGKKRLGSVGRPVPGVEIQIVDKKGQELQPGETGEIWMRGPHTIQGYFKDLDQTKENFTNSGFWKSGDLGYFDEDGFLYLVDRKKDMIITGGFNVYAVEVEKCLERHPQVVLSSVVGIPDEQWGEAVHAEVILKDGTSLSEDELILFCKNHLTKYKVPKSIAFVRDLPLSSVGKILKRVVRQKYWNKQEKAIH